MWLESCRSVPCHPAYQRRPRNGPPLGTYAVLHYTAPPLWTADQYAKALQRPPEQRTRSRWSAHVIIGRDGHAVQCVPLDREASHAGDGRIDGRSANIGTWGIEVVSAGWAVANVPKSQQMTARHRNPASNATQWHLYTEEQYKTLATVLYEMATLRPNKDAPLYVLGHEDVTNQQVLGKPGSKVDPGPALDWGTLIRLVNPFDPRLRIATRVLWDFTSRKLVGRE